VIPIVLGICIGWPTGVNIRKCCPATAIMGKARLTKACRRLLLVLRLAVVLNRVTIDAVEFNGCLPELRSSLGRDDADRRLPVLLRL
jgi:hypothetical protein